jgi:protein MpaA
MPSKIRKILLTFLYTLTVVFASGCAEITQAVDNLINLRPGYVKVAGRTVNNRTIEYSVHGTGEQTVLILGAIHGSEPASAVLVGELQKYLVNKPQPDFLNTRRVVIIPVANPDGLAVGTRSNTNGVDLNRNFPTANRVNSPQFGFRGLTEPESRVLMRLIDQYKPAIIVSVHQPLACVDYDGPALVLAEQMAQAANLPVRKLGAMPGSLGSFAGETLGIPIITFELPPGTEKLDERVLWELYKQALFIAIEYEQ